MGDLPHDMTSVHLALGQKPPAETRGYAPKRGAELLRVEPALKPCKDR